jgi:ABC-2 type transport system permease protein
MTSLTLSAPLPPATRRSGLPGALRSEWVKLRSVRSTVWTLTTMVVLTVAMSAWYASNAAMNADIGPDGTLQGGAPDPTRSTLMGIVIGQMAVLVIGALAVTSEYSTGMIRTSLTAMPRRGVVAAAKAIVLGGVTLAAGELASFAGFFIGRGFWDGVDPRDDGTFGSGSGAVVGRPGSVPGSGPGSVPAPSPGPRDPSARDYAPHLGDPGVLRAVICAGVFLAVTALFAFGLGTLLRSSAGTITASFALLFVLPGIVLAMPGMEHRFWRWTPFGAASASWGTTPLVPGDQGPNGTESFGPLTGLGVFAAYALILILLGTRRLKREDA